MFSLIALKLLTLLLVIVIGYACGRMRWLGDANASRVLGNVAFYIFVPALLFRTTARIDFATMPWRTLAVFFVPASAVMVGVYVWQRRLNRDGREPVATPGVRSITATFGNTVQMGIPMATAMFGEAGLSVHVAIVSLHALTLLTIATAFTELDLAREHARRSNAEAHVGRMLWSTARNTVIHPVTLPILVGLAWNAVGLPIPAVADELLVLLSQAVVPVCLLLIGLSLAMFGLKGSAVGALKLSVIKLLLLPAIVLVIGHWGVGLSGLPLAVVVMAAALPTGNNAVIMAQRYDAQEGEATSAIVLSTFLFVVTAPFWLSVLRFVAP
jgi:malonate transporter